MLDRRRPVGEHHHLVGQKDRLPEVCVIKTPVNGSSALSLCIVSQRSSRVNASSAPNGSSRIKTSGLWIKALHRDARWRIHPIIRTAVCPRTPMNQPRCNRCLARSSAPCLLRRVGTISRGRSTFFRILRHSIAPGSETPSPP